MKKLLFLSTLFLAVLGCVAFVSCAEDDDEKKEQTDNPGTPDNPDAQTDQAVKLGYCPDTKHPHLIDLGDGMQWSCCNVGAKAPWEHGGFYAWGELETKQKYDITTYEYSDKKDEETCWELEKMYGSRYIPYEHTYSISATPFDVAYVKMGKQWMMPNYTDADKLYEKCKNEITTLNGVPGCKVTGPSKKYIFLPEGGFRIGVDDGKYGGLGQYWCGTRDLEFGYAWHAWSFTFNSYTGLDCSYTEHRWIGDMIRPIKTKDYIKELI